MKAMWKDQIVAQSDQTVVVENNHYFPIASLNMQFFIPSEKTTFCGWKGKAEYYSIVVNNNTNLDAAWYYADPKEAAAAIKGHVAFWRGVVICE